MDHRQNNGSVKVVSPHHCAVTCALRNCYFNCHAGQSQGQCLLHCCWGTTRSKRSLTFTAQLHLPAHDLFWANLRVQLHLPPLDLAWNPVNWLFSCWVSFYTLTKGITPKICWRCLVLINGVLLNLFCVWIFCHYEWVWLWMLSTPYSLCIFLSDTWQQSHRLIEIICRLSL